MVFKRCPKGYERHGCCTCAIKCPSPYIENGFHCHKPQFKILKTYESTKECNSDNQINCVRFGTRFVVGDCGENYERVGATMCVPKCPLGWKDEGKRCFKPGTFHNGPPFTWAYGDEDDPNRDLELSEKNFLSEDELDSDTGSQEDENQSRNLDINSDNDIQSDSNEMRLYENNNTSNYNILEDNNTNRNQDLLSSNFNSPGISSNRDSRSLTDKDIRNQNNSDTLNSSNWALVFDENKTTNKGEKNSRNIFNSYVSDDFDQD